MNNYLSLYEHDRGFADTGGNALVGVDEAGRGPLAGPVIAAAVSLDLDRPIAGVNDSKKLSAAQREELYGQIIAQARSWAVGEASVSEIDAINILQASLLAMERAIAGLACMPGRILIDGLFTLPHITAVPQMPLVKGDGRSASIAAASIVAKVTRDRIMTAYARQYPQYEFEEHKGYATQRHREHIERFGLCPIHRKTFCEQFFQTTLDFYSPVAQGE
ncbi:MAG: ribonuclease HII [Chitinivibrionales bacterium]|nr:ribonuclease HII [Chitinivibrionales bacterium]